MENNIEDNKVINLLYVMTSGRTEDTMEALKLFNTLPKETWAALASIFASTIIKSEHQGIAGLQTLIAECSQRAHERNPSGVIAKLIPPKEDLPF